MFTEKDTMTNIMKTEPVQRAIGNLFPSCWIPCVDLAHWNHSMEKIAKEDKMEWGQDFWSEPFVECANLLMKTVHDQSFCFVPLWREQETLNFSSGWIPDADGNCEESVWLFTGNPQRDSQAFAHTSGNGSIPPYPSNAVSEEEKDSYGNKRPAVIFCPGGGYEMLSYYSEGIQLAQRMERDGGYKGFVLNYRIRPNTYPQPQMDLAMAILHVRAHAQEYGIDPEKIFVVGASAGGHLCASEAYLHKELKEEVVRRLLDINMENQQALKQKYEKISARPDALGLLYPVISFSEDYHEGSYINLTGEKPELKEKLSIELHIDRYYPPTYALANEDDGCVPVSNTIRLDQKLEEANVKHLCQVYPQGDHGIGLGYGCSAKEWSEEMLKFFQTL